MTYSIRLPDGTLVENIPDEITPEAAKAKLLALRPELGAIPKPAPSKERTFGEAATDIGAGLVGGAGKLIQLPGQLYGLATGDFSQTGSLGLGKKIEQAGEEMKSAGLKAREQERAEKIAEAEKKGQISAFGTALGETLKDPGLLLNFLAEQAPQLLVPFGAGRVGSALTAGRAGTRAAIGAGAVQQGADIGTGSYEDIYKELIGKGVSEADAKQSALNLARASGASGAVISLLAQKLPGAKRLEEAMAGVPSKTGRVRGAIGTAAGETLGEIPEEVGGKLAQNIAMREVKPEQELTAGLGETAAMAAIGGAGMGGAAGLARGRAKPEVKPEVPEVLEAKRAPEKPLAIGVSEPFTPVVFPDGSVATSPEEVAAYEKKKFEEKYAPQDVEKEVPALGLAEPFAPVVFPDGSVATTPEEVKEYERQQFEKKYAPQEVEKEVPALGLAEPFTPVVFPDGSVATTPEDIVEYERQQFEKKYAPQEVKRETAQTTPTTEGEEDVARPNEPTSGTGVPVPVRAADELPATEGVEGTEQRGVDGARPTPTEPAGGAGVQPTPVNKRKLYKEPEPIKGEPMPLPTEVEEAEKDIEAIEKLRRKVETREKGPSLFNKIRGTLSRQEMSELTDAPKNIFVAANSEKKGALLTDLVADGYFDDFLPYRNRATDPGFDESSATEYIKDKIRNRNYLSYATEQEIKQLNSNAAQLREVVSEYARMEEANALAQEATEEGRNEILESSEKSGGYNIDPQEQTIEKELAGKKFMQVAQWAVRSAPNAFAKVIAQKVLSRLQSMQSRGVKFDFKVEAGNERSTKLRGARGVTNFVFGKTGEDTTIKITLNGATVMDNQDGFPSGMNYVTVLHELLHAATRGQLKFMQSSDPLVKELIGLRNKVIKHFNDTDPKDMTPFMKRYYNRENNSLDNIDEMVSWGMTDEDMQKFLGEIKVGEKTGFSKLVETIRKILGLGQPYESALDRLVRTTESILDESIDVIGDGIESQGYSYGTKAGKKSKGQQQSLFSKKVQEMFGEEFELSAKDVKEKAQQALQKQKPITSMEGLDDEFVKKLNKIFKPENKTFIDKVEGFKENTWKKLAQGIADQYRTIKDYSEQAYMMARMSKSVDGALEGILFHGHVFNDGGALNIKQNTKGLIEAMKPLGTDVDRYQMWIALNRDARLPKDKRSFDPELVAQRGKLAEGTLNGKSRLAVYEAVQKDMNALNRSVLDVAYDSGLINSEAYEVFSNDIFYIPFYQQMEDGDIQGASTASGLVGQKFSKQLKGGEKQLGDLMENTLRNWSHILSASMKNQAANETIKAAEARDAAFEVKEGGKNTVKVMRNGDPIYFEVANPMLLDSIMAIAYTGPKSKFLDVAKNFKNMLQFGVTISPAFKVRNLFRDSISAMAVTDLKKNPFTNIIEGWIASDKNNPAHISALAGGAIFNFGSTVEGDQAALTKRLIEKGVRSQDILDTPEKVKEGLKYLWDKYQEFGNKSEAANRMALYNQLIKQGKTHLEAAFYARDMMDFSMQGSFGSIRMVAQVVPFFNARVQGLYKLGRDGIIPTGRVIYNTITGKEIEQSDKKKAASFSIVTGAVALASMALYLGFKDDEEFQKREAWDRDNFWWFKLPGMEYAVRIPKPFEIGAFGTIAERTLEQIIDQGAEGKQFGDSLSRMLWDTFSMNPMPQVFKPMVDLYANKDSFTGAPIETAGMERLSKQERVTDATSPIAKLLGGLTTIAGEGLSPVQIDYAIKAYFGWLGGTAASVSTYAVAPFKEGAYPDMKWADTVSMGFIKSLPANQSRYVTAFYENNQQINQAFADMKHYAELGDSEKVQEILEKKGDMIALQKMYDKTAKNMANVRKQIRLITDDKEMSGADKREEIDRLKQLISMMAEQAEAARKSMKS